MSNAVKYAVAGSSILVKCEYIEGYVQVSVKDEGMGIAKEEINKLIDVIFDHAMSQKGTSVALELACT